jgi:hypothetical protein
MQGAANLRFVFSKAHIFESKASLCARCGSNFDDARNTPFRCVGVGGSWDTGESPYAETDNRIKLRR